MSEEVCRYCGRRVKRLYTDDDDGMAYELQWGHFSLEDAQNCVRPEHTWPHPERKVIG